MKEMENWVAPLVEKARLRINNLRQSLGRAERPRLSWWDRWMLRRDLSRLDAHLAVHRTDSHARMIRTMTIKLLGRTEEALAELQAVREAFLPSAFVAAEGTWTALSLGRHQDAQEFVSWGLGALPADPELLRLSAIVSLLRHDLPGAEYGLRRALEHGASPDAVGPLVGMIAAIREARTQFPISIHEIDRAFL